MKVYLESRKQNSPLSRCQIDDWRIAETQNRIGNEKSYRMGIVRMCLDRFQGRPFRKQEKEKN